MRKLFLLFIPISFLLIYFGCQQIPTEPEDTGSLLLNGNGTIPLMAGQNIEVGYVDVWNDGTNLYVEYVIDEPGWCLEETHLAVAYSLEEIPQTNKGNPIPGQFPYKAENLGCALNYTYTIPLVDINPSWDCNDDLYIAAHAVVSGGECYETASVYGVERETGSVYNIDVLSGTSTIEFVITPPPPTTNVGPNGLAYDETTQRMYYLDYQSIGSTTTLYFWDGSQHVAGTIGNVEVADADFDNGKYYYITGPPASDDLYEVEFNADGTISSNLKIADVSGGQHRWTFSGDIAVKEGVVYGWGLCGVSGHGYEFFTYDIGTPAFSYTKPAYQNSLQLAFGSNGVLYGHRSGGTGAFYVVDQTDGSVIMVTPTPSPAYYYTDCASGIQCVPEEETAWAGPNDFPGNNWALYFEYTIECNGGGGNCEEETAWGGDTQGGGSAWWYYFDTQGPATQTITAGKTIDVGSVYYNDQEDQLEITLTGGWELQAVSEPVKIQGYNGDLPETRPAAGLFTTYKGSDLTVPVPTHDYYAIHLDVQWCLP